MKLVSWNVNGIRAVIKKGAFAEFITREDPDVLCLQETKAKQGQAEIDLPQYEEFWNSADKPGYSGTAIFTKIKPLSVHYGFPDEITAAYDFASDPHGDPTKEGRVLAIELPDYYVATVYTPNSKGELTRLPLRDEKWDPAFLDYMNLLSKKKPVVFCGDLNVAHREIDLANPKQNVGKHGFTKEERRGFQNFLDAGFVDTFRELHGNISDKYTWWSHWANARARNVGWRIDYFLASKSLISRIEKAEIFPNQMGSDHCPIGLTIKD